jgi:hypothetical protein
MTISPAAAPNNFLQKAGKRFGIDLLGLFQDEEGKPSGFEGFVPSITTRSLEKGRGGVLSYKAPKTPTRETVFQLTPEAKTEAPAAAAAPEAPAAKEEEAAPIMQKQPYKQDDMVRFSSNYLGDLSQQEAAGKAAQLLHRAIGATNIRDQETFNKLFEPLYTDLQSGADYGADVSRFYKAARSAGYEPYTQTQTDIKPGQGDQPWSQLVGGMLNKETMQQFYDPADYGRRILEAKAYYEPGGVGTNLTAIGNVQNKINELGEESFYGKTQGYKGGYRQGIPSTESDPFRQYYEAFLKG